MLQKYNQLFKEFYFFIYLINYIYYMFHDR